MLLESSFYCGRQIKIWNGGRQGIEGMNQHWRLWCGKNPGPHVFRILTCWACVSVYSVINFKCIFTQSPNIPTFLFFRHTLGWLYISSSKAGLLKVKESYNNSGSVLGKLGYMVIRYILLRLHVVTFDLYPPMNSVLLVNTLRVTKCKSELGPSDTPENWPFFSGPAIKGGLSYSETYIIGLVKI